jgi:hypothetical protein
MRRVAAIAAVALVAAALGRLSAPGGAQRPSAAPSPGPSRIVAGVGVGYAHSRAGAALAAARYQQSFAGAAILRPGVLRARVAAVATPDFAPTMLAANSPGARRLASGPLGKGLRGGVETIYAGVPVGYRVLAYSPGRAVVRIWGFTLLGNASSAEPSAYFGLSRTVLVWSRGDWKIAETRASFGPTPRLVTPRRGEEGFGLIDLARELAPYGIAP